jgi:hypothetical protein
MVSYVTGTCSLGEKRDFETHCLACDECRITLEILRSPITKEEEITLAPLYMIGIRAASVALWLLDIEAPVSDLRRHLREAA